MVRLRRLVAVLVVSIGLLEPASAQFGAVVYSASTTDLNLRRIDPVTGTTLSIVPMVPAVLPAIGGGNGLAAHPTSGVLWGVVRLAGSNTRVLARIDPLSGNTHLVGPLTLKFSGITFGLAGQLYGVTGDGAGIPETLFTISTVDASIQLVLPLGNGSDGEAIAFNGADGLLYHGSGYSTNKVLESIDPNTLQVTNIPLTGAGTGEMSALTHFAGVTLLSVEGGTLTRLTTAGASTALGVLDHTSKGLAWVPSPPALYSISNSNGELRRIDPMSGVTQQVIPLSIQAETFTAVTGLTTEVGTGWTRLYAAMDIQGATSSHLFTVVPTSGEVFLVGDLGDRFAGLAMDATGALFGVTDDAAAVPSTLYRIDRATAATTPVLTLGNGSVGEAISFHAVDELVYHASGKGAPNDMQLGEVFERIDPSVPSVVPVPLSGADYDRARALAPWAGAALLLADDAGRLFAISRHGAVALRGFMNHVAAGLAVVTRRNELYSLSRNADSVGRQIFLHDALTAEVVSGVPIQVPGLTIKSGNGLAIDSATGDAYAVVTVTGQYGRVLIRLDPTTGAGIAVGNTMDDFAGLAFDASSTLFGVTGDGALVSRTLFTIDTATAVATPFMTLGNGDDGEAIAFLPSDGQLYHGSGSVFERIDVNTQTITDIGYSGFAISEATAFGALTDDRLLVGAFSILLEVEPTGAGAAAGTYPGTVKGLARREGSYAIPFDAGCPGAGGFAAELFVQGTPSGGAGVTVGVLNGPGGASGFLLLGLVTGDVFVDPGCSLRVVPTLVAAFTLSGAQPGAGAWAIAGVVPPSAVAYRFYLQAVLDDPGTTFGSSATNAIEVRVSH